MTFYLFTPPPPLFHQVKSKDIWNKAIWPVDFKIKWSQVRNMVLVKVQPYGIAKINNHDSLTDHFETQDLIFLILDILFIFCQSMIFFFK